MSKPDVTFHEALSGLRMSNGRKSLRVIAARAGVSHSHVANVLNKGDVPSWNVARRLVTALGGQDHDLAWWEAAWRNAAGILPPTDTDGRPTAPAIPGYVWAADVMAALAEISARLDEIEAWVAGTALRADEAACPNPDDPEGCYCPGDGECLATAEAATGLAEHERRA